MAPILNARGVLCMVVLSALAPRGLLSAEETPKASAPRHGRAVALHPNDPRVSLYHAAVMMGHVPSAITTLSPVTAREASQAIAIAGDALTWVPDTDGLPVDAPGSEPGTVWPSPGAEALAERIVHVSDASLSIAAADVFTGDRGIDRFRDGERVEEGGFGRGQATGDLALASWAHVALGARAAAGRTVTRVTWPRASLVLREGGARLTIGREPRWWGPGVLNEVLLTTNAFPTDAIELATDGAHALPLGLGSYKASVFLGYLDDANRPTPYPLLFGHRAAWRPLSWLELGAARTIMLGGAGRTERYTWRSLWDIFLGRGENSVSYQGFRDTDHKVGLDGVVFLTRALEWVPGLCGARAFYRYAGDDSFEGVLPTRVAHHYGGTFLFSRVRLDVELLDDATAGVWYWNSEYPAGYTYHGDFLATDVGWDARSRRVRACIALARDLGLRTEVFVDSRGFRRHQEEGPGPVLGADRSIAVEWALALTRRLGTGVRVTLEYRNRQADGFTFDDDRERARHLARLSVRTLGA